MEVNVVNQTLKVIKAWYGLNQRYHNWGALQHVFWENNNSYYNFFTEDRGKYNLCEKKQFLAYHIRRTQRNCSFFCNIMVRERHRKEPKEELEKWKRRSKVWEKLREGSISTFIRKIHDWDPKITYLMVKSWKDGKVKIDGIDFQENERVITEVIDSPNQGIKFYRNKEIALNVVKYFSKDTKEMKDLVKTSSNYELTSIKNFWRFFKGKSSPT